jgi:pimeloyl-ACP methyl ester carboxylesterase
MANLTKTTLSTPHGTLSITDTGGIGRPAVLFIHGNSFHSGIFRPLLSNTKLTASHRLIAFDLPGHGDSSNAPDPEASYTQPAYADAALRVLRHLGARDVVVVGWSLGGHVALEMLALLPPPPAAEGATRVRGTVLVGTPPVARRGVAAGFRAAGGLVAAAGREGLTRGEEEAFARAASEEPREAWMVEAVRRADPRARRIMFEAFAAGRGADQRAVVGSKDVLVAVVNGKMEPFVNLEYVRGVEYGNLWKGECFELEGLQHAPFWGDPERFVGILMEFLGDVATTGSTAGD